MIAAALLLSLQLATNDGCAMTMAVPLFACKNGTATAALPAIPGASYTWTVEGAAITGGTGTNRVQVALTNAAQARLSCTVVTSDCTSSVTGVISVRDPLTIHALTGPSSVDAKAPVTLTWSYDGVPQPVSQLLTGDVLGTPVALPAGARSYMFVPQSSGAKSVELLASYAASIAPEPPSSGKRRSVGRSVIGASACPDARASMQFEVRGCVVPKHRIIAPSSADAGTMFTATVDLIAGETAHWSVTNGTIVSAEGEQVRVSADSEGTLTLTVRVEREPSCFAESSTVIAVKPRSSACPVAPTALLEIIDAQCDKATLRATFTGRAPFYGQWSDGQLFVSPGETLTREVTVGSWSIVNFRDAVCPGSVMTSAKFEYYRPRVTLETVGGKCTNAKVVAKFTGQAPFTGRWRTGEWFTTSESQLVIDTPQVGSYQIDVLRDSRCPTHDALSESVQILQPAPVARMVEGPYCQYSDKPAITVIFDSNMPQPPYTVWWADGTVSSTTNDIHTRFLDQSIAPGGIVSQEIVRAATGQCEALVPVKKTTVTNRPQPRIDTFRTDTVSCVGKTGKAKLAYMPPGATIVWSLPNATILTGQGTADVTYRLDAPGQSQLRATATYPDGACSMYDTASVLGVGTSTVANFRAEPATIKAGSGTTLKFTTDQVEAYGIIAIGRPGAVTLDVCNTFPCTAKFVDTIHTPGKVTIEIQFSNHCDAHYKTATTEITIEP